MAESGGYGERFGARLKIGTPVFFMHKIRNSLAAVTEVRSDNPVHRLSQPPRAEDALQIALQLRDFPVHETWVDGKAQPVTALRAGDTTLYDLRRPHWPAATPSSCRTCVAWACRRSRPAATTRRPKAATSRAFSMR